MTEKEILKRAFRALDGLAGRQVKSQSEAKIQDNYTSRRCIPEPPKGCAEIQHAPELADPAAVELPPSLKGQAIELWRDGRRFFLVADDEDALEAIRRSGAHRGEIWTGAELELVASLPDQGTRDEVESFKRQIDGCLSSGAAGECVSAAEWQAQMLNQLFKEQGTTGQPGKITAATVRHGERGRK